ncbi:MAG: hypothetical protein WCK54_03200 [Desulfuromonadales bacterium]
MLILAGEEFGGDNSMFEAYLNILVDVLGNRKRISGPVKKH